MDPAAFTDLVRTVAADEPPVTVTLVLPVDGASPDRGPDGILARRLARTAVAALTAGGDGLPDVDRDAASAAHRDATDPIRVAVTAVFSRRDRVVAWPACIDRTSRRVLHVEVRSSHAGMGIDPHVWATAAAAIEGRLGATERP